MRARSWTLVATILGSSMAFLDGSVVAVAAPAMRDRLDASTAAIQWVMNGYLLLLGGLMLTGGALGDRWGRLRMFVVGAVGFTLASVACGLAPDVEWLIGARLVQGAAGALLVPGSLALLRAQFPEDERGRAIGTWAGAAALTTALGPVLGGWLVDALTWRAIFFLNVPLGAATVAIAVARVPHCGRQASRAIDVAGSALAIAAFGALGWALVEVSARGATPAVIAALAGGAALLVGFVVVEARAAAPMMPLGLFRSRTFAGANGATLVLYAAFHGALFLLPFDLIDARGYAASTAGAALLPMTIPMALLSRAVGGWAERHGVRRPMIVGPLVVAAAFATLGASVDVRSYGLGVLPGVALLGLGMAITVAPLTTAVMGAVDDRHAGVASGVNNTAARLAGLVGVALLGAAARTAGEGAAFRADYAIAMYGAAAAAVGAAVIAALTVEDPRRGD